MTIAARLPFPRGLTGQATTRAGHALADVAHGRAGRGVASADRARDTPTAARLGRESNA